MMAKSQKRLSKAARNERAKLRAIFWNNLGVGVLLGGSFIPLFAAAQHLNQLDGSKSFVGFLEALFPLPQSIGLIAVAVTAIIISSILHAIGLRELEKVKD